MAEELNRGLYVAIDVRPTNGVRRFLEKIPEELGEAIRPTTGHVTLTYPYDFPLSGIECTDSERFDELGDEVSRRIDALNIRGEVIMPERYELQPYQKFVGIPIEPAGAISEAHNVVSEAVREEFGVRIPNWREDYHFSVARRSFGRREQAFENHPVPFPNGFIAGGSWVRVREIREGRALRRLSARGVITAASDFSEASC